MEAAADVQTCWTTCAARVWGLQRTGAAREGKQYSFEGLFSCLKLEKPRKTSNFSVGRVHAGYFMAYPLV